MKKILLLISLLISNICFAEKLNRITLNDLGYSTATGGYIAVGYGRALNSKNLVYSYIGSWSRESGNFYGVGYKYFLESQTSDNWFGDTSLSKNQIYRGDFTDSTILSVLSGYQWIFKESFGLDLAAGVRHSDITGTGLTLFRLNFSYLF